MSHCFDAQNAAARKKLRAAGGNVSDNWEWFRFERIGPDILCEGSECRRKTRGKDKGSRMWFGPKAKVVISPKEIEDENKIYEHDTGNCSQCCGDGQEWMGWSAVDGDHWKPCHRCGATGKVKA